MQADDCVYKEEHRGITVLDDKTRVVMLAEAKLGCRLDNGLSDDRDCKEGDEDECSTVYVEQDRVDGLDVRAVRCLAAKVASQPIMIAKNVVAKESAK